MRPTYARQYTMSKYVKWTAFCNIQDSPGTCLETSRSYEQEVMSQGKDSTVFYLMYYSNITIIRFVHHHVHFNSILALYFPIISQKYFILASLTNNKGTGVSMWKKQCYYILNDLQK